MASAGATPTVGPLLREWRERRRLSQMDLAADAGVSARHLSFVETGRSRPSPDVVLQLAERLEVPLRDRNRLLLAAGYAPVYQQRELADPEMEPVREAIALILDGHDPYPAVVVDHAWEMLAANRAVRLLMDGVAPDLLEPPVNVLRLSLHPEGRGAADRQPGRVAGPSARPARPADRAERRRPGARHAARGAERLSGSRATSPATRDRRSPSPSACAPRPASSPSSARWPPSAPPWRSRPASSRSSRSSRPTAGPPRRCERSSSAYLPGNRRAHRVAASSEP